MSVTVPFDASSAFTLPPLPAGQRCLAYVTFQTCPGTTLRIVCDGHAADEAVDRHGVAQDAWWRIVCDALPDRVLRIRRGAAALRDFLNRYGFQDASGCVNHERCVLHYTSLALPRTDASALPVPHFLHDACGVPQFTPRSGNCWFTALCTALCGNEELRELVAAKLPTAMRDDFVRCLHDRDAAQRFRAQLWYRFGVGDNVEDRPENDGCNGMYEFTVLCAQIKLPLLRYRESNGTLRSVTSDVTDARERRWSVSSISDGPHILLVRYIDGEHHDKFPILRRVYFRNQRYRLVAMLLGQKRCGHQIGIASPTGSWQDWVIGDADLHKHGIGMLHIRFPGRWHQRWWDMWRSLVHVTKFDGNRRFCNFSPHNEDDDLLDRCPSAPFTDAAASRKTCGQCSIDLLYTRIA